MNSMDVFTGPRHAITWFHRYLSDIRQKVYGFLSENQTGDYHELNGVYSHVARCIEYLSNDLYDWFIPNGDEIYQ